MAIHEVAEGLQEQTSSEEVVYTITTTNQGSSPSSPSVVAYEEGPETVVTGTVFPTNSPSVVGDVITLSALKTLTKGKTYRVEVLFTTGFNKLEAILHVRCVK